MSNESHIEGSQNIVIQDVTESTITINVDGQTQEIHKQLNELKQLLLHYQTQIFQSAGKSVNIDTISEANFRFVVDQSRTDKSLPEDVAETLIKDREGWIKSLQRGLQKQQVSLSDDPSEVIKHYGWLIETYLQKMLTEPGQAGDLRSFSFMTEAFHASLRYLCFIHLAQILKNKQSGQEQAAVIQSYLHLNGRPIESELPAEHAFDYLNLLIRLFDEAQTPFLKEMPAFITNLLDVDSDEYATVLFLEAQRNRLLKGEIQEEELSSLIPQYLTGLTYWLRRLAFLANYRLLSIKDIYLSYRLGTTQSFIHYYGELHGMYDKMEASKENNYIEIEQYFTYNQSVLFFKGSNVEECLKQIEDDSNFLSLSPLVIDQSVFQEKSTQTPEIYYYIGQSKKGKRYHFAQYRNELPIGGKTSLSSNKTLKVIAENMDQPKLNDLYEQLKIVFEPFHSAAS